VAGDSADGGRDGEISPNDYFSTNRKKSGDKFTILPHIMRLRGLFPARFTPPKQENVFEKEKKIIFILHYVH